MRKRCAHAHVPRAPHSMGSKMLKIQEIALPCGRPGDAFVSPDITYAAKQCTVVFGYSREITEKQG